MAVREEHMLTTLDNPYNPSDTSTAIADAAVSRHANFLLDDINRKENVSQRYSRRLWENNTFGKINKNKALTNEEVRDIVNYQALTNPQYRDYLLGYTDYTRTDPKTGEPLYVPGELHKTIEEQEREELAQLEGVKRPEDYYGDVNGVQPTYTPNSVGGNLSSFMYNFGASKWGRSAMSDFILRTNESQMKVTSGQIQRSKEFTNMADGVTKVMDDIDRYTKNLQAIERYNTFIK